MDAVKSENRIAAPLLSVLGFLALAVVRFFPVGPLYGISTLLWLGLFLYTTTALQDGQAMLLCALAFPLGYIVRYFGTTGALFADILLLGLVGLVGVGIFALNRLLLRRWDNLLTTLCFPLLWSLCYFGSTLLRFPSVLRMDIQFFDLPWILQGEAYLSSYGLSFLILWLVSLFVYALRRHKLSGFALSGALLAGLLLSGFLRLSEAPAAQDSILVAYTTGPYVGDFMNYITLPYEELTDSLDRSAAEAAEQGAALLVFNEEAFELLDSDEPAFLAHACEQAEKLALPMLIGLDVTDTDGSEEGRSVNELVWIDAQGNILAEYRKHQTIPLLEDDYVRGDGVIPTLEVELGGVPVKAAFAICYDSNFPGYLSQLPKDTDLLFLPSWDWDGVTDLHYRICGTIAVERHLTLLKPTYDGYSAAIDPYGRIVALTHTDETGYESVQTVQLPLERRR